MKRSGRKHAIKDSLPCSTTGFLHMDYHKNAHEIDGMEQCGSDVGLTHMQKQEMAGLTAAFSIRGICDNIEGHLCPYHIQVTIDVESSCIIILVWVLVFLGIIM